MLLLIFKNVYQTYREETKMVFRVRRGVLDGVSGGYKKKQKDGKGSGCKSKGKVTEINH